MLWDYRAGSLMQSRLRVPKSGDQTDKGYLARGEAGTGGGGLEVFPGKETSMYKVYVLSYQGCLKCLHFAYLTHLYSH